MWPLGRETDTSSPKTGAAAPPPEAAAVGRCINGGGAGAHHGQTQACRGQRRSPAGKAFMRQHERELEKEL
jgi:hypothetical protein